MKTLIAPLIVALAGASFSAQGIAAADHDSHGAIHAPATAEAPLAEVLVKKIDKLGGKLTLSHGPLPQRHAYHEHGLSYQGGSLDRQNE